MIIVPWPLHQRVIFHNKNWYFSLFQLISVICIFKFGDCWSNPTSEIWNFAHYFRAPDRNHMVHVHDIKQTKKMALFLL